MSKHLEVPEAVKAMVKLALPGATVLGMNSDEAKPETVGPLGMVIVRSGDPGDPEIDLSPPAYHFERVIPIELAAYQSGTQSYRRSLAAMIAAIGALIVADRSLGGLCDWLDAEAPTDGDSDALGAAPLGWADFNIIASYATTSPLG